MLPVRVRRRKENQSGFESNAIALRKKGSEFFGFWIPFLPNVCGPTSQAISKASLALAGGTIWLKADAEPRAGKSMRERGGSGFFDEAELRDAAFSNPKNGQANPGGAGEDESHRSHGVGVEDPDAGGGKAGDADLQEAEHGGGAADVAIEGSHGQGGGVGISETKTGEDDEEEHHRCGQPKPATDRAD